MNMQRDIIINLTPVQVLNLKQRYSSHLMWVQQVLQESLISVYRLDDQNIIGLFSSTDTQPDVFDVDGITNILQEYVPSKLYVIHSAPPMDDIQMEFHREFQHDTPSWIPRNSYEALLNAGILEWIPPIDVDDSLLKHVKPTTLPLLNVDLIKSTLQQHQYIVYTTSWNAIVKCMHNPTLWKCLQEIVLADGLWIRCDNP